jgi:hypothetical protein
MARLEGIPLGLSLLLIFGATIVSCNISAQSAQLHRHVIVVRFAEPMKKGEVPGHLAPLKVVRCEPILPGHDDLYDAVIEDARPIDEVLKQLRGFSDVKHASRKLEHRHEFVVQFADQVSPSEVPKRLEPLKVLHVSKVGRYYELVVETNLIASKALELIQKAPSVEYVEPNVKYFKKKPTGSAEVSRSDVLP